MDYEEPLKRDISLEKVKKICEQYLDMNKKERLIFLNKVIQEDCENFLILPKSAKRNYFYYKSEE